MDPTDVKQQAITFFRSKWCNNDEFHAWRMAHNDLKCQACSKKSAPSACSFTDPNVTHCDACGNRRCNLKKVYRKEVFMQKFNIDGATYEAWLHGWLSMALKAKLQKASARNAAKVAQSAEINLGRRPSPPETETIASDHEDVSGESDDRIEASPLASDLRATLSKLSRILKPGLTNLENIEGSQKGSGLPIDSDIEFYKILHTLSDQQLHLLEEWRVEEEEDLSQEVKSCWEKLQSLEENFQASQKILESLKGHMTAILRNMPSGRSERGSKMETVGPSQSRKRKNVEEDTGPSHRARRR